MSANRYTNEHRLRHLAAVAKVFRDGFTYDPGHSDLDNEQPIHVRVTLGDWRKLDYLLNAAPQGESPSVSHSAVAGQAPAVAASSGPDEKADAARYQFLKALITTPFLKRDMYTLKTIIHMDEAYSLDEHLDLLRSTATSESRMSDHQKIYWRVRRDVNEGSLSWTSGWIIGFPAAGLIEIGSTPAALSGTVMSLNDIVYKEAT